MDSVEEGKRTLYTLRRLKREKSSLYTVYLYVRRYYKQRVSVLLVSDDRVAPRAVSAFVRVDWTDIEVSSESGNGYSVHVTRIGQVVGQAAIYKSLRRTIRELNSHRHTQCSGRSTHLPSVGGKV